MNPEVPGLGDSVEGPVPSAEASALGEMSDQELDQVAGGAWNLTDINQSLADKADPLSNPNLTPDQRSFMEAMKNALGPK